MLEMTERERGSKKTNITKKQKEVEVLESRDHQHSEETRNIKEKVFNMKRAYTFLTHCAT